MRTPAALVSAALVLALSAFSTAARADSMDPAIERLSTYSNGTISTDPSNPRFAGLPDDVLADAGSCRYVSGERFANARCTPDHMAFAKLINQYGAAIAPTAMHSGRTTGFGGFHLSFEGAFTTIDNDADYWKKGSRGPQDASNKKYSINNNDPAGTLQVYSIKVRKGFPFGLEVAAQVGTLAQTSIITGGADVRMSLLEGFRKGALGILPDLAAGGGVRTISGTPQFNLTVASFDVQISKNLPIAESSILIPYVGFQYLWIFGDSGTVDSTPKTDPLGYCNFSGTNVPGNSDPKKTVGGNAYYDGQPNCQGGAATDFNSTFTFNNVRVSRQRLVAGLNYRFEYVYLGGQFMTDIVKPEDAGGRDNKDKLKGEKAQNSFVFELGAFF